LAEVEPHQEEEAAARALAELASVGSPFSVKSAGSAPKEPGPRQDQGAPPNRAILASAAATLTTLASLSSTDAAAAAKDDVGGAVDTQLGGSGPAQGGLRRARRVHAPAEARAEAQGNAVVEQCGLGAAAVVSAVESVCAPLMLLHGPLISLSLSLSA
jgi:hypothetical protein